MKIYSEALGWTTAKRSKIVNGLQNCALFHPVSVPDLHSAQLRKTVGAVRPKNAGRHVPAARSLGNAA
jgi:hypothetical protein